MLSSTALAGLPLSFFPCLDPLESWTTVVSGAIGPIGRYKDASRRQARCVSICSRSSAAGGKKQPLCTGQDYLDLEEKLLEEGWKAALTRRRVTATREEDRGFDRFPPKIKDQLVLHDQWRYSIREEPKSDFEPQCHVFRTKQLRKPRPCHLCHQAVIKQASCCRVCKYICHKTCEDKVRDVRSLISPLRYRKTGG
ncbi:hypothetical protein KM043_008420 [Ampulex compressa]|nr:hypothetical protein KM043_008420 [Ampulex compressa]